MIALSLDESLGSSGCASVPSQSRGQLTGRLAHCPREPVTIGLASRPAATVHPAERSCFELMERTYCRSYLVCVERVFAERLASRTGS